MIGGHPPLGYGTLSRRFDRNRHAERVEYVGAEAVRPVLGRTREDYPAADALSQGELLKDDATYLEGP